MSLKNGHGRDSQVASVVAGVHMGRVTRFAVRNYRSFRGWADVHLPEGRPVVIFGENNAGKTNLASALELVLGERWPGSHKPEDHEFFDRSADNAPMQVLIDVTDVHHVGKFGDAEEVVQFSWRFPNEDDRPEAALSMSFANGRTSPYVSNLTREQCFCLMIAADRRLPYQLSYASQWTFLSKLMRKFHEALVQDENRVGELRDHFASVKRIFRGVPEFETFSRELARQLDDLAGNFEYQLSVDFSAYDPSNYFKSLKIFPTQEGDVRSFDELGTGQEQVLAIAFAWAYAKAFHGETDGLLLVIEEPEAHLHPLAQRWLSRRLHELAAEGLQILITTHSPAFLAVENLEGLVRVSKTPEGSRVHQHTAETFAQHCRDTGAASADAATTLPRYAAWSTEEILAGLFSRTCVLVEGPTEAMALPVLLSRVGYDAEREGTAFISVGGVGDLAKWWRFFTAYDIPCYAFFDRDEGEDADGQKRRDLMTAVGLTDEEAAGILESAETVEHARVTMLSPDFEGAMAEVFGEAYTDLQLQARTEHALGGNQAKPLVGRFVAERIPVAGPAEEFLKRLTSRLRAVADQ